MIGKTISHYKILEKIGEGGMGVVYKAKDTKLDRIVALKFLPKHLLCDEEAKTRFIHEAKAASALNHPNIATIHEIDEVEGECFICMEYVEGRSLKEVIKGKETKAWDMGRIIDVGIQIGEGLSKAHQKGIIHRDIKSDNIMLTNEGLIKIMDFGLAKLKGAPQVTKAGTTVGTVAYMSPEQAKGEEVDHRTDIWSLGVIFYEMITGQLPFKGDYEQAVVYSILNEEPKSITDLRADLPGELEQIVNRALLKATDSRYQNTKEILIDLRKLKKKLEHMASKDETSAKKSQPSIAVLPFRDMSAQKDQEYLCEGMAENIINALTQIEELHVVARTSAFAFKNKQEDIREIGRKLSVETLLEGSIQKAGNRLRITAQLVSVADGYHLWSDKYDRDMADIFAIQDEISLTIVEKLKIKLLGQEKAKLGKRYTDSLEAYNVYLKGRYFWSKRTREGLLKSLDYFQQAIKQDPTYALAYAGIADCYNMLGYHFHLPPKEAFPKAKAAAEKALKIDETLAEAHTSLAHVRQYYNWDWLAAEKEYKRAIELNPSYPTAYQWYAEYLMLMGRDDESIAMGKRALELDPLSTVVGANLAFIFWLARRYDQAIEECQKVLEIDSDFWMAHNVLGRAYAEKEMYDKATEEIQKSIVLAGTEGSPFLWSLGETFSRWGKKDKAKKILADLIKLSKRRYISPVSMALNYLGLGHKDKAFQWLEKAYRKRDNRMVYLKTPFFDNLRSDPRYEKILKKMGLEK